MRRMLSYTGTKMFWVLLGLIGLSLLIWFFGGIIAIGDYKPLENKVVRVAIIALIFVIWISKILYKRYLESKRNSALVEEIKSSQQPILKHVKKDSPISQQFEEIDAVLKSAKFSDSNSFIKNKFFTGQYLYQLPWYVILGAAGTGKTTVLKQSGLNFPLESSFGASISGLVGTRDCDWFLSDDAVLLDTAGRLSLHDSNEEDSYDWQEFIGQLKRYRPKQPINGVVVTVGIDDILNPDTDFSLITRELRKRIHEMRAKFGINFPVYLIITKLDILKGFNEFFSNITEEERDRALGFTLPTEEFHEDPESSIAFVAKELEHIQDSIEASYLKLINSLKTKEEKDAIFTFSSEFEVLNKKLLLLFKELYKSSKFEDEIQWRGIFFTSATQDGSNIDPVFNELMSSFKLTSKYIESDKSYPDSPKSYFIHNLFKNIIFKESDLADSNKIWSKKRFIIRLLVVGAMIGATIIALAMMFNSYLNNDQYLKDVNERSVNLDKEMKSISETKDLLQAVLLAEKIKKLPESQYIEDVNNPPLSFRMALYQGYNIQEVADSAYQRALRERVMPLISYKLDELLRSSANMSTSDSYNALKAYLMLYDDTKFDSKFMLNWLMKSFDKTSGVENEQQKEKVKAALEYILEQEGVSPSLPLDTQLVDRKRQAIARNDISIMILNDTFQAIVNGDKKVTPVSFDTMGGKQSRLIFTRVSGKPITEGINPVYTKQAYLEFVLPELLKSTSKLYTEEDWVLGNYASLKSSEAETLKEAKKAYFQRYISEWNKYIADIRLKQPRNLREARDIAKILSDTTNSPLRNMIIGISENTTLNLQKQLDTEDHPEATQLLDRLVSRAGFGGSVDRVKNIQESYVNTLKFNTPVDDEFMEFHLLTATDESNSAVINEVILSIKDLYEYLDILNIAVEKGVDMPSNDSLFKYRAEVNRLPTPFRQMFDQFSVFVLNQSLDEMNERLLKAKLEEEEKEAQKKREEEEKEERMKREQEQLREEQMKAEEEKAMELKKKQEQDTLSSLEAQLQPITNLCKNSTNGHYPFSKSANIDMPIESFDKLFNSDGFYYNFMKLDPEISAITQATSLNDLMQKRPVFKDKFSSVYSVIPLNRTYFLGENGALGVNVDLRVVNMDPGIDKLIINYDGRSYTYSHGPSTVYKLSWPAKKQNKISVTAFSNEKLTGKIERDGPWAIFRLVESGSLAANDGNKKVIKYKLGSNNVLIEFSSKTGNSPFNLSQLRRFSCP